MSLSKVTSSGNCFRYSTISLPSGDVMSMVALTFIIPSCFIPASYKYMNILPMQQKNILSHDIHQRYFKYQHGMSRYGIPSVRPVRELPRNPYFPFVAHLHMLQCSRKPRHHTIHVEPGGSVLSITRAIENDLIGNHVTSFVRVSISLYRPVVFIPSRVQYFHYIGK